MKLRIAALLVIFGICAVFGFILLRSTNSSLDRHARSNYEQSFLTLAYTLDSYLSDIRLVAEERDQALKGIADAIGRGGHPDLPGYVTAAWRINPDRRHLIFGSSAGESKVIGFYNRNLAERSTNALIVVDQKTCQLFNYRRGSTDLLFLVENNVLSTFRLNQILVSLMRNSDLRYFSILDRNQTPLLYESRFENYLPLLGPGEHRIATPAGLMLQIERPTGEQTLIAGFDMSGTARAQRANLFFIIAALAVGAAMIAVLTSNLLNFARFRVHKERELAGLRELAALSAGFTHEFKNSLQALNLVARRLDGPNRAVIESEVGRMDAVIKSFSLLAQSDIKPVRIELAELIDEASQTTIPQTNAFSVDNLVAPKLGVAGDRSLLILVFNNLLRNSIEAGARQVRISADSRRGTVFVNYHDDGPGLDPTFYSQLFEPFYSRKQQTGLGLFLVKKILLLHDGDIEPVSGKGARFRLTLRESR